MALTISDLPDEMLAEVLARVPFSKEKVAAQCVCKKWQEALQSSAAHSTDTLAEDSSVCFDCDPTLVVEVDGDATRLLSGAIVNALASLKLAWEDHTFEWLTQWPVQMLQNLRHVEMFDTVSLGSAAVLFQGVANLPNIEFVGVMVVGGIVDFIGPEGCKVDYEINVFYDEEDPDSTKLEVPEGMARHLQILRFRDRCMSDADGYEFPVKKVDLGKLANCEYLEEIYIDLDFGEEMRCHFCGLDDLPPSVQNVYVSMADDPKHAHFWQLGAGWLTSTRIHYAERTLVISRV